MTLYLLVAPQYMLPKPNEPMRLGQIPIQRQGLSTLGDTLGSAVCPNLNDAEIHVGSGMIGRTKQHAVQRGLRGIKMRKSVIGHKGRAHRHIDLSCANRCFDIDRVESKG